VLSPVNQVLSIDIELMKGLVIEELPESAQEEMDNHERYAEFRTE
jgi:hypothetical protein